MYPIKTIESWSEESLTVCKGTGKDSDCLWTQLEIDLRLYRRLENLRAACIVEVDLILFQAREFVSDARYLKCSCHCLGGMGTERDHDSKGHAELPEASNLQVWTEKLIDLPSKLVPKSVRMESSRSYEKGDEQANW